MIEALEGVFSPQAEDELVSHLTDAILRTNDASDNSLARRRLTMPGSHMPADKPYAAGKPEPFINVARRVPTSSPNTPEKRRAFVTTMTNTIEKAAASCLERDRIYINMPYGDRFWGVGGKAYTDKEVQQEVEKASPTQSYATRLQSSVPIAFTSCVRSSSPGRSCCSFGRESRRACVVLDELLF
jgi:hypothetical protein